MSVSLEDRVYSTEDVAMDIISSPDEAYQRVLHEEDSSEQEVMMDIYDSFLDSKDLVSEGSNLRRGGLYLVSGSVFAISGSSRALDPELGAVDIGAVAGYLAGGAFLLKHGLNDVVDLYGEKERSESYDVLADLTVYQKKGEDLYRVEYDPV